MRGRSLSFWEAPWKPYTNELKEAEFEAEARLAVTSEAMGLKEAVKEHISRAKAKAGELPQDFLSSMKTDDQFFAFIRKIDEKYRKSK